MSNEDKNPRPHILNVTYIGLDETDDPYFEDFDKGPNIKYTNQKIKLPEFGEYIHGKKVSGISIGADQDYNRKNNSFIMPDCDVDICILLK